MGKLSAGGNNRSARTKKSAGTGKSVGRKNVASMNRAGQKCCSNSCELFNINSTKTLILIFGGGVRIFRLVVAEKPDDNSAVLGGDPNVKIKDGKITYMNKPVWVSEKGTADGGTDIAIVMNRDGWGFVGEVEEGEVIIRPIIINGQNATCLTPDNTYQYMIENRVIEFSVRYV